MFVKEIISTSKIVDGRKFFERTIQSQFKQGNVSITTIYMDNKPILKNYVFQSKDALKHILKRPKPIKTKMDIII